MSHHYKRYSANIDNNTDFTGTNKRCISYLRDRKHGGSILFHALVESLHCELLHSRNNENKISLILINLKKRKKKVQTRPCLP